MALTTLPTAAFASGSVGTAQLADGAVTTEKMKADVNFRNLIINGDMSIAQRGTSITGLTNESNYGSVDRYKPIVNGSGTWTSSQETDVPTGQGFAKSMKMACTTLDATPNYLFLSQKLEGQMLQQIKKGTANAESLTASFWVKSNKTGTYILELYDTDNARRISNSYTINSAATWEKKTLTFAGDTTGTLDNDNAQSLQFNFWLAAGTSFTSGTLGTSWAANTNADRAVGQVNLADSTSNYINFTGVQLEIGTSASDFEFLPYDVNLRRCQRYFYQHVPKGFSITIGTGHYYNSSDIRCTYQFPTTMRANPSLIQETGTNAFYLERNNGNDQFNSWTALIRQNVNTATTYVTGRSGTAGQAGICYVDQNLGSISFDAEL
jgi:hypothetical protein